MHNILKSHWVSLLAFIGIIAIVQFIGNLSTMPSIPTWYAALNKPSWTPPNWVFGPVWTILYVMLAVTGWRLWIAIPQSNKLKNKAFLFYSIQIVLNFLWSPLFFHYHFMGWALIDLILMIVFTVLTIKEARKVDKTASWMLVPYLMWISYAATLNAGCFYLN